MNQLVPIAAYGTLIATAGECAQERFIANIRNRNTRQKQQEQDTGSRRARIWDIGERAETHGASAL